MRRVACNNDSGAFAPLGFRWKIITHTENQEWKPPFIEWGYLMLCYTYIIKNLCEIKSMKGNIYGDTRKKRNYL